LVRIGIRSGAGLVVRSWWFFGEGAPSRRRIIRIMRFILCSIRCFCAFFALCIFIFSSFMIFCRLICHFETFLHVFVFPPNLGESHIFIPVSFYVFFPSSFQHKSFKIYHYFLYLLPMCMPSLKVSLNFVSFDLSIFSHS
jgi:hypothetical protein